MKLKEFYLKEFCKWIDEAKWYHFWNPGTGFIGGCVLAVVVLLFINIFII
jgi:hypothetical protein